MKDIEIANELEQLAPVITKAIVRLRYDHPKRGQEQSVLPEFEEWWGSLPVFMNNYTGPERRYIGPTIENIDHAQRIYNSLKSMVRPITDEEVVARFNEIPTDKLEVGFPQEGGHFKSVIRVCHPNYRLKPQEPEKEPWEVAWEANSPFSMPDDHPHVSKWRQMFKLGYQAKEAATKGGGDDN